MRFESLVNLKDVKQTEEIYSKITEFESLVNLKDVKLRLLLLLC